jgi:hypothetical protein
MTVNRDGGVFMMDHYETVFTFLEESGLDPKKLDNNLIQFWHKEERYYFRLLENKSGLRIFHPRVWHVESHMEFGVATFTANEINKDSFVVKLFVNENDHYVYAVVGLFFTALEEWKNTFFDYMQSLNWAIVEFRQRAHEAMEAERNPE